jgi:hypothetical protein
MAHIINMARATRPIVSERQRRLCKELVGLGLARNAITSLMLGKDLGTLSHSDLNAGHSTINSVIRELGFNIVDSRHVRSPAMIKAVREAAGRVRMRVRIA